MLIVVKMKIIMQYKNPRVRAGICTSSYKNVNQKKHFGDPNTVQLMQSEAAPPPKKKKNQAFALILASKKKIKGKDSKVQANSYNK
jgi:hypothetical protein